MIDYIKLIPWDSSVFFLSSIFFLIVLIIPILTLGKAFQLAEKLEENLTEFKIEKDSFLTSPRTHWLQRMIFSLISAATVYTLGIFEVWLAVGIDVFMFFIMFKYYRNCTRRYLSPSHYEAYLIGLKEPITTPYPYKPGEGATHAHFRGK